MDISNAWLGLGQHGLVDPIVRIGDRVSATVRPLRSKKTGDGLQGPGGRVRLSVAKRNAVAGANGLSRAEYEGDR